MYQRHFFSPLCLFCAYDSSVLQNFKIFTHLLLNFSYSTLPLTEVEFESCVECNYFNDRERKVRKTFPEGCKAKSGIAFRYCKTNILQLLFDNVSDVTIIFSSLLSSSSDDVTIIVHLRYYRPRCFFNVNFLSIKAVCKIKKRMTVLVASVDSFLPTYRSQHKEK